MNMFGVLSLLILVAHASAELQWDFGEWIPIPGKCATCERGRIFLLESESGRSSSNILSNDLVRKKKAFSPGPLLKPANLISQKHPFLDDDPDRVQLIYLPEGSINDLRTARVAKVKGTGKVLRRSARETSFSARSLLIPDQEAVESTISFKEISPKRPTALVAEKGKEREAHEQIQLLEAALNAHPNDVREGELPRVFIAPTHLPPPPGYVKIPLLPSQSHVGSKKTLPRTFLTSEHHSHLPPGFIQVPLPEKVSQLSHSIPFVNPESNPALLAHINQQSRQNDQLRQIRPQNPILQRESDFSRPQQQFNILQPIQDGFNLGLNAPQQRPQHIQQRPQQIQSTPQQTLQQKPQQIQQERPQQDLNNQHPAQQNFDVNQIVQNHFNIRRPVNNIRQPVNQNFNPQPFNQNFNIQPVNQNFNPQPINQDFRRGQIDQGQQTNVNQPLQQEFPREEQQFVQPVQQTVRHRPAQLNVNLNENQQINKFSESHAEPVDNIKESRLANENKNKNVNQGRGRQRIRQQNLSPQEVVDPTPQQQEIQPNIPLRNTRPSSSFFEIGSSVIKPENNFDYTITVPDFNAGNDYEQDFPQYDQEFVFPENNNKKQDTTTQDIHTPENKIQPDITTTSSFDDSQFSRQSENLKTDEPRNVFQLSPIPIHVVPTLSPSPVELKLSDPQETITEDFNVEHPTTGKTTSVQLFPKLVKEDTADHDIQNTLSLRQNNRGRLRQNNFRGRVPDVSARHRLNLSPQKVVENVEIGTPVVTKEVSEDHTSEVQHTSPSPTLSRVRGNLGTRRRRPLRKETTVNVEEEPSTTAVPEIASSSTLFPPFSVAKRLNEKTDSANAQENRSGNLSGSRGRFGSRIRAGDNSDKAVVSEPEATLNNEEQSESVKVRGQRRRRLRGRNGTLPAGQRRRRVLSRVRKISPSSDDLNNQIQNEEQLRVAESERVLFSHVPLNKVPDPISKTLELINDEKPEVAHTAIENNKNTELQETSSSDLTEVTLPPENNLNLLSSIISTNDDQKESTTGVVQTTDQLPIEVEEDAVGYVNNSNIFPEHESALTKHGSSIVSVDSQDLQHDNIINDIYVSENKSEPVSFSSGSVLSSISHVSNDENIPDSIDDSHAIISDRYASDQSQNKHLFPQSTFIDNEKLTFDNNIGTFLPENEPNPQGNYYDDYDNDNTYLNNGTYVGSSAHVVYAVALSEAPSDINENDFTTESSIYEELLPYAINNEEVLSSSSVSSNNTEDELLTTEKSDIDYDQISGSTAISAIEPSIENKNESLFSLNDNSDSEFTTESNIHSDVPVDYDTIAPYRNEAIVTTSVPEDSDLITEIQDLGFHKQIESSDDKTAQENKAIAIETTTSSLPIILKTYSSTLSSDLEVNAVYDEANSNLGSEYIDNTSTVPPVAYYDYEYLGDVAETSTSNSGTKSSQDQPQIVKDDLSTSSQYTKKNLTGFLDDTFTSVRESKENTITIDDQPHKIISKSTITEVRSSAPVICIKGKCVIGSGLKKR